MSQFLWPSQGLNTRQIESEIKEILESPDLLNYSESISMGFPALLPTDAACMAYSLSLPRQLNSIGTHTGGDKGEHGFVPIQEIEKKVVQMTGQFVCAPEDIQGYVASGGTEANIVGVWLAREQLNLLDPLGKTAVIVSHMHHYSIRKATHLLFGIYDKWLSNDNFIYPIQLSKHAYNGDCLILIGTDQNGRILIDQVEDAISILIKLGYEKFIIISNEGNTMTGNVDDTHKLSLLLDNFKVSDNVNGCIHVDACFGGIINPFVSDKKLSFACPRVLSVAIDLHKMGRVPYGAGIVLYRKQFIEKVVEKPGVTMGYVPGDRDGTLCGSRPAAVVFAAYASYLSLGWSGYEQLAHDLMDKADMIRCNLSKVDKLEVLDNDTNMLSFRFKDPSIYLPEEFCCQYKLPSHDYLIDLSASTGARKPIYRTIGTLHLDADRVKLFVQNLNEII